MLLLHFMSYRGTVYSAPVHSLKSASSFKTQYGSLTKPSKIARLFMTVPPSAIPHERQLNEHKRRCSGLRNRVNIERLDRDAVFFGWRDCIDSTVEYSMSTRCILSLVAPKFEVFRSINYMHYQTLTETLLVSTNVNRKVKNSSQPDTQEQ